MIGTARSLATLLDTVFTDDVAASLIRADRPGQISGPTCLPRFMRPVTGDESGRWCDCCDCDTGAIGREIARLLRLVGMDVKGAGRTRRSVDSDFGTALAHRATRPANWLGRHVVVAAP